MQLSVVRSHHSAIVANELLTAVKAERESALFLSVYQLTYVLDQKCQRDGEMERVSAVVIQCSKIHKKVQFWEVTL